MASLHYHLLRSLDVLMLEFAVPSRGEQTRVLVLHWDLEHHCMIHRNQAVDKALHYLGVASHVAEGKVVG